MSNSEILDLVDKQGNIIGQATKGECHSNPDLIHQVVHCWLINPQGQILWQQRSLQKDTSPGKWDMSCGGHMLSGEQSDQSLARELEEELGLTDVKTHLVKTYIWGNDVQTEYIYLYYAIIDQPADQCTLQVEEVEQVKWIDLADALEMVRTGQVESTPFIYTQPASIFQKIAADSLL